MSAEGGGTGRARTRRAGRSPRAGASRAPAPCMRRTRRPCRGHEPKQPVEHPGRVAGERRTRTDSSRSSARRFASARNSASRNVQTRSQGEMRTSTAIAPAAARSTNNAAIARTSMSPTDFSQTEYAPWSARKASMQASEAAPSAAVDREGEQRQRRGDAERDAGRHATGGDRTGLLHGMQPVGRRRRGRRSPGTRRSRRRSRRRTLRSPRSSARSSPSSAANTIPAKSRRFFVHCRGRMAATSCGRARPGACEARQAR